MNIMLKVFCNWRYGKHIEEQRFKWKSSQFLFLYSLFLIGYRLYKPSQFCLFVFVSYSTGKIKLQLGLLKSHRLYQSDQLRCCQCLPWLFLCLLGARPCFQMVEYETAPVLTITFVRWKIIPTSNHMYNFVLEGNVEDGNLEQQQKGKKLQYGQKSTEKE